MNVGNVLGETATTSILVALNDTTATDLDVAP